MRVKIWITFIISDKCGAFKSILGWIRCFFDFLGDKTAALGRRD